MNFQSVESSNIDGVYYDEVEMHLFVKFKNNTIYQYYGITRETYEQFLGSESKGKYFNAFIKDHHTYQKVA